jgi:hypothetical protein
LGLEELHLGERETNDDEEHWNEDLYHQASSVSSVDEESLQKLSC